MKKIFNQESQKQKRQFLRSDLPKAEQIIWGHLRKSQLGVKFRRQAGIGVYIVDFYCPRQKLVIEVDGDSHSEITQIEYDKKRTEYLIGVGVSVVRFTNHEVYYNLEEVLKKIKNLIN